MMPQTVRKVFGWVLLVGGTVFYVTPIPLGLFIMPAGAALLIGSSPFMRRKFVEFGRKRPNLYKKLKAAMQSGKAKKKQ
jgi:hypothetical protein